VLVDTVSAFDRVWHKGLLTKLKSIGIQGPLLSWIENCLLDRKQRVAINGCCSDWPIRPTFFFYVGSRLGQIFHARIRMGCSALNSDLFRKNIVNSPHCTCGAIETPTHYPTDVKKCGFIMYNIKVHSRFEYINRRTVFCAIRKKIPRPYCLR
jgi:hypothetical protein